MKKFGLLCVALVLVIGTLGIGYAAWTDTIFVNGTVNTGSVCVQWTEQFSQYDNCPHGDGSTLYPWYVGPEQGDPNLELKVITQDATAWPTPGGYGWPNNWKSYYTDKNVACLDIDDTDPETLLFTIYNGYPLYYQDVEVHIVNCGTVPVLLNKIEWEPIGDWDIANYAWDPGQVMDPEWNEGEVFVHVTNGVGEIQLEPGEETAFSAFIIVQQSAEQGETYEFQIEVEVIQWDEYGS